jgi:prephenate dehydratase
MTISIQGKIGSYSYLASKNLFAAVNQFQERDSFKECYEDLKENRADCIIIPFENSTYGSVFQNYDLITQYNYSIIGEVYLKVNFHLITYPGNKLEDIKELYIHPVAMGQITEFLKQHPQIKAIEYPDTAGSVNHIKDNKLINAAAAASKYAAEINEMEIIQENIQTNKQNYTRFFCLADPKNSNFEKLKKTINVNHDNSKKTSIEFQLGEEAGSLFKAIKPFAEREIPLVKIESRPIINTHWQFMFYIDFKSDVNNPLMQEALKELEKTVKSYRILGSYSKGEYINT